MPWSLLGRRRRLPINSPRRRARPKPMVEPLEARCLLAIGVTELPAPGPFFGITNGPDGNLWFTELLAGKVGHISPAGAAVEFAVPGAIPAGITGGPDGNLWFADERGNIDRITPSGTVTPFGLPAASFPFAITAGPDGNLWFTETVTSTGQANLGRITPAGAVTLFPLPDRSFARGITAGPDGNLWFADASAKIGRITPGGALTEFVLSAPDAAPFGITAGPDGNLWFTDFHNNEVGRITPAGAVTTFPINADPFAQPIGITAGPDGNLWFIEETDNRIGRITTSGVVTEFAIPTEHSSPANITTGPDGNLWFNEEGKFPPAATMAFKIGRVVLSTSGTASQRFVAQVYIDLLARLPDLSGLVAWSGAIDAGVSRSQVILGIESSAEYRIDQVEKLYNHYLLRDADAAGLQQAVAFLANGATLEQLAALIAGSPEYFQIRANGMNDIFLLYFYLDALKREPDGGAETAFSQALAAGITRTQVAAVVFGSSEYKSDLVQSYYQQFLHRTAAPAELNPWVNALLQGARDEQVIAGILSSDEYFARSQ
jgi:streptogramin lyase